MQASEQSSPRCTDSLSRAKLTNAVNSIVDGLKSFSPTDSDPKAVVKRTNWLANELDQESISTEDQIALTAVLSSTHVHEAKMELQHAIQHLRDDYLAVHNDLLDAQRRISKLEDLVRVLTLQRTPATDSPKLAQLMEVTSSSGQTLGLSIPKGKALVPLNSSRTSSPTPSATNSDNLDDEKAADDHLGNKGGVCNQIAENEKLSRGQEAKKVESRLKDEVKMADLVRTPTVADANKVQDKKLIEHESKSSAPVHATASPNRKLLEYSFLGNDKPLPPVPAAQDFPQSDSRRYSGQRRQSSTDLDQDQPTKLLNESIWSSAPALGISLPSATTSKLAEPVPAVAQTPQASISTRFKGKATRWKDPPLFQDEIPAPASTPFQFSVSSPFDTKGQSSSSTGHSTQIQQSLGQVWQHADFKQVPSKAPGSNEATRQLGDIKKVLQDNKDLDEGKPLQKKPVKASVFASADAMMEMIKSVAPDSGYVASSKSAMPAAYQAAVPQVQSTLPTAAATVATRSIPSAPPSDSNNSQSSFFEVPKAPTKKRRTAVKLVKPETEPVFPAAASSSTTHPWTKEKSEEASLPTSSAGPSTPSALETTSVHVSTSPSTVTSSSPLTPTQAPAIKINRVDKAMSAGAPAFAPSSSTGKNLSSFTSSSPQKKSSIPDSLRKQMSPNMLAMLSGNMKSS